MNAATRVNPAPTFHIDPLMTSVVALLLLIGVTMMTSASIALAERTMDAPLYFFVRQSVFLVAGLGGAALFLLVPTRVWESTGYLSLSVALALLVIVLVPGVGHTVNGSTRWIDLGPFNLQASEPARLLLLFYVCGYLVRHHEQVRTTFTGFAKPMLFVFAACALLVSEPDLGAATVLLCATLGVLFIAGVRLRYFLLASVAAIVGFVALILTSDYRRKRLIGFRDPWADPEVTGYQLTQSLIAIGRGEWSGVGLGASVQKLDYLPHAHNDFVFAVLAEELGLIGVVLTIGLYLALIVRGFGIARRAADAALHFQAYLAYAIVIWIGLQALINIGVNMGVLPTKGLTLPLMSYGGSSLVVTLAAIAILLRVHHETRQAGAGGRA